MHRTVKALFDATAETGDEPLLAALSTFFAGRVSQFTSQVQFEKFDGWGDVQVNKRTADRLTVFGFIWLFGGKRVFWLDLVRDSAPGITARWVLYCDPDDRTRAGRAGALNPWAIEHPESLDWRVFISNAEIAEDTTAR